MIWIATAYTGWLVFTFVRTSYKLEQAEEKFARNEKGSDDQVKHWSNQMTKVTVLAMLSMLIFYLIDTKPPLL